jgi:diguanylate cyclase (GGDEF)-like protein
MHKRKSAWVSAAPSQQHLAPQSAGFSLAARVIAEQQERIDLLAAVIDNFPGGLSLFDRDLKMVLCNQQQKELLGYPDSLFAKGSPTLEDMFRFNAMRGEYGPGDVEEQVRHRMDLAREKRAHVFERTRPNGTILEIRGAPLAGGGFVTTYLDVTEQRRNQALVAHMAHHDALTDLPNRTLFRDRMHMALAQVKRGQALVALHCLDLDRFKPVNDNLGHAVGDALLQAVAGRLRSLVRETDTVARIGGDEFSVIQMGISGRVDAKTFAERLADSLAVPFRVMGQEIEIGTSNGIALAPDDSIDEDTLMRLADKALYACKSKNRGWYRFAG